MPYEQMMDKIISGGYAKSGQQNFGDLVSAFTGRDAPIVTQEAANLRKSKLDLEVEQRNLKARSQLEAIMANPPKTADGTLDYEALAEMAMPLDPTMAINIGKAGSEQAKSKVETETAKFKFNLEQRQIIADELTAVADQATLDQFISDAAKAKIPLPPTFPTVFTPQAKAQLLAQADQIRGQNAVDARKLTQAQIDKAKAEGKSELAQANRDNAMAEEARAETKRIQEGLPPKPSVADLYHQEDRLNASTERLAARLQQGSVPMVYASVTDLNNRLKPYEAVGNTDIPGLGYLKTLWGANFFLSDDGKDIKSSAQAVANDLLKMYSGMAVTPPESARRDLENMRDGSFNAQDFIRAWPRIVSRLNTLVGNERAGFQPEVVERYESRMGAVPLDPIIPAFHEHSQSELDDAMKINLPKK